ncbi:hypothetical protein BDY21DRAFT_128787 [Lineolata rhizophorae]|uniref:Cyclin-like protein n=1 Tax=Lineolata rhizophorae TaxID=578093 RepID=A0A6A6NNP7_9PEZI|nr:hypothetical protein BDY21DRAFT_128787 [Lineolata rhizophorae]
MPSFYRRATSRDLPPTPPEFVPSGYANGCGAMQYSQASFSGLPGVASRKDGTYDFVDGYGRPSSIPGVTTMVSRHPPGFSNSATSLGQTQRSFYEPMGAPLLPPMRTQESNVVSSSVHLQAQQQAASHAEKPAPKEDKAVGGVSAKLDYDMDVMTEFVSEMTQGMYALLKSPICLADIDIFQNVRPGTTPIPPQYTRWVHQVLSATRLPSATILQSLSYLSIRMTMLSAAGHYRPATEQIYNMLTIALVLGSKFLDDNTFINRSWSEVSHISVAELNRMEMEWLVAMDFNLHRNPSETQGFCSWLAHWKEFEARAIARAVRPMQLSPLDTTVQRQPAIHSSVSPHIYQQQTKPSAFYLPSAKPPSRSQNQWESTTSTYSQPQSQYDPWIMPPRSATEGSPASAPHTGPTTPEYYGNATIWATPQQPQAEGYSRRTMFGFPPVSQPQPQVQQPTYHPATYASHFGHRHWPGHGLGCNCGYCPRQPQYLMAPGHGPQPVVG